MPVTRCCPTGDVQAEPAVEVERGGHVGGDEADRIESWSHESTVGGPGPGVLNESDVIVS